MRESSCKSPVLHPQLRQIIVGIMTGKPRVSLWNLQGEIYDRSKEEDWWHNRRGNQPHLSKDEFTAALLREVRRIFFELRGSRANKGRRC